MVEEETNALNHRLSELNLEHRDLDEVIARLVDDPHVDELRLRRLKKRKLMIKDQISTIERMLTENVPA